MIAHHKTLAAIFMFTFFLSIGSSHAQNETLRNFKAQTFRPTHIQKKPGHYTREDWARAIDETWGVGESTAEKLRIFDAAIAAINANFAAFHGFEINLDSLGQHYRSEIALGCSRGRFSAIMSRVSLLMDEGHTFALDLLVGYQTALFPGVPIFYIDAWTDNTHFGAGLTPLPDSSLLVYKVVEDHPLGLKPGDIVLGYDGVPWRQLMRELWEAELPVYFSYPHSSTKEATTHRMLMAAGMNWHLFDTVDIVKYDNKDTLHLSTLPLANNFKPIWGNEQVAVPGVPFPNFVKPVLVPNDRWVNWGIVEGTKIGYIYVAAGLEQSGPQFFQAVDSLMNHRETTGLIIDYRLNYGGGITANFPAYAMLFNDTVKTVGWHVRCGDPDNHLEMCPNPLRPDVILRSDPATFYDKPIAVLTGPACFSGGDQNVLTLSHHPRARLFGKPTGGGFTASGFPALGNSDWFMIVTQTISYLLSDPQRYLARWGVPVDEEVWLTPDDVARGRDTVVEAAIAWINATNTSVAHSGADQPASFELTNSYPNPFNPQTTITYRLPTSSHVTLTVFDSVGRVIRTLVDANKAPGEHVVRWDGKDATGQTVGSGVYFYRLQTSAGHAVSKKMLFIK